MNFKRATCVILLPVATLGLLLLVSVAFCFPKQVLTVDSGWVHADALVVLGGGTQVRAQRAAELFKLGAAPLIILTGAGDWPRNQQVLEKYGVPATAVLIEKEAKSTFENAKFTVPMLRARAARQVIIVTSWYHSRRALQSFRHFAPEIKFYSSPAYLDDTGQVLSLARLEEVGYMRREYFKLFGYWMWHGISPFVWY